jgi:hypothetical protein
LTASLRPSLASARTPAASRTTRARAPGTPPADTRRTRRTAPSGSQRSCTRMRRAFRCAVMPSPGNVRNARLTSTRRRNDLNAADRGQKPMDHRTRSRAAEGHPAAPRRLRTTGSLNDTFRGLCSAHVDECSSPYRCQLCLVFGSVAATPGDQASGASTRGTGGDRRRCAPPAGRAIRAPCRCVRRPRRTPPPRQSAPAPTQAPRPWATPRAARRNQGVAAEAPALTPPAVPVGRNRSDGNQGPTSTVASGTTRPVTLAG